jgi:tetratricopeptide (TPR) repeat protein
MVLLLAACAPRGSRVEPTPGAPVVIVSIDTLRSDRLPAYGYSAVATPAIDALRRDAILFERAYSHIPLTLPSHASLMTSRLPGEHGVRDNLGYRIGEAARHSLAVTLGEHGYRTGAAVSAIVLRHGTGIETGFEFYDDAIGVRHDVSAAISSRVGTETLEAALGWLRSVAGEPFFLFFHIYEPHTPYEPAEPFASRYPLPYDAEIASADAIVGQLLAELRRLDLYDGSTIVLLSDHGEGFGDHGEPEHGVLLYREALQVPLMVKLPGEARAGESVAGVAGLIDVAPTIVETVGVAPDPSWRGSSLLGEVAGRAVLSESFYARLHYGWSELFSVIEGERHYIKGPDPELYDLAADPGETRNILRAERQVARSLDGRLAGYAGELVAPGEVDESTRRELEALGYLTNAASPPAEEGEARVDPKARIGELADLWRAREAYRAGDLEAVLSATDAALAANPEMADAWELRGLALESLKRPEAALAALTRAMDIAGATGYTLLAASRVQLGLGRVEEALSGAHRAIEGGAIDSSEVREMAVELAEMGRWRDALSLYGRYSDDPDPDSRATWARILSEAGRQEEAAAILTQSVSAHPEQARAYLVLGLVRLRQGMAPEALAASQRAIELAPEAAGAWSNQGAALYLLDRRAEAVAAWRRAVELDPEQYEALFNLGIKAPEVGDLETARWALRLFLESAPRELFAEDRDTVAEYLRRLGG